MTFQGILLFLLFLDTIQLAVHFCSSNVCMQCSTICGAIEDRSISLKAIDERVFTNFRDKNAVFTNLCNKNAVFTHFHDKNAVFTHFCVKIFWFHKYVTICLTRGIVLL